MCPSHERGKKTVSRTAKVTAVLKEWIDQYTHMKHEHDRIYAKPGNRFQMSLMRLPTNTDHLSWASSQIDFCFQQFLNSTVTWNLEEMCTVLK